MDFNLIVDSDDSTDKILKMIKRSFELGYECVALNTVVSASNLSSKNINIPNPKIINFDGKFGRKFQILNRLTAIVEDPIQAHNMLKSPVSKKYDILSVEPVGEKNLQHVVTQCDVDIICLKLSEDLGFPLKKSHVGLAFQKGMCFEISYAPCFKSQNYKRSVISNSLHLVSVCKSENIIISSSASRPLDLRSPEDVVNLSLLFGFKTDQAVRSVRKNGHIVMSHAGTRKNTGCGFVSISGCLKIPKQQGWVVKMCKVPPLTLKVPHENSKLNLKSSNQANDMHKLKKCKLENYDNSSDTHKAKKCKLEN